MIRRRPIDAWDLREQEEDQAMLRDQFRTKVKAIIASCDELTAEGRQLGTCKWMRNTGPYRWTRSVNLGKAYWKPAPKHFVFIGHLGYARNWCARHSIPFGEIRTKFVGVPGHLRGIDPLYYKDNPAFLVWLPRTGTNRDEFMEIKDHIQRFVGMGAVFYSWLD